MHVSPRVRSVPLATLMLAIACGGGDSPTEPAPNKNGADPRLEFQGDILAGGEFGLRIATSFSDPGFHDRHEAKVVLPSALPSTAGRRLVLVLWDASRPGQTCSAEHPTSGCATVDWDDFPGRPNTPTNGIFSNRLEIVVDGASREYFLRKTSDLAGTLPAGPPT